VQGQKRLLGGIKETWGVGREIFLELKVLGYLVLGLKDSLRENYGPRQKKSSSVAVY
jgi:hypothetical protein